MTLWNKEKVQNVADELNKPNWLTDDEKARCYCDNRGWVLVHLNGTEEILVAANSLNDPTEASLAQDPDKISVGDTDGDGTRDYLDTDMDDDGTDNTTDPDIDGDGTDNAPDPAPLDPNISE